MLALSPSTNSQCGARQDAGHLQKPFPNDLLHLPAGLEDGFKHRCPGELLIIGSRGIKGLDFQCLPVSAVEIFFTIANFKPPTHCQLAHLILEISFQKPRWASSSTILDPANCGETNTLDEVASSFSSPQPNSRVWNVFRVWNACWNSSRPGGAGIGGWGVGGGGLRICRDVETRLSQRPMNMSVCCLPSSPLLVIRVSYTLWAPPRTCSVAWSTAPLKDLGCGLLRCSGLCSCWEKKPLSFLQNTFSSTASPHSTGV